MVITNGTNGNGSGGSYSAFEALMAMVLSEKLTVDTKANGSAKPKDEVERIRQSILQQLSTRPADVAPVVPDEPRMPATGDGQA
jgi:hypothetical protein